MTLPMQKITKALLISLSILFILLISVRIPCTYADTELEHTALARVLNVLDSLTPLINEAESQQEQHARLQFHYDWLRDDINQIKQGIEQKLKTPCIEPRIIKPLKGDYLELQSKKNK